MGKKYYIMMIFVVVFIALLNFSTVYGESDEIVNIGVLGDSSSSSNNIEEIFNRLNRNYEIFEYSDRKQMLDDMENDKIDLIANTPMLEENDEKFIYSEEALLLEFFLYSDKMVKIEKTGNSTIAIFEGSDYAEIIPQIYPRINIITVNSVDELTELMKLEIIDGFIGSSAHYELMIEKNMYAYPLENSVYDTLLVFMSNKGQNEELIMNISEILEDEMFSNILQINRILYNEDVNTRFLEKKADEYKINSDNKYYLTLIESPPMVIDDGGEYSGIITDFVLAVFNKMGINSNDILINSKTWDESKQLNSSDKIEIIAPFNYEEGSAKKNQSTPYMESTSVVICRNEDKGKYSNINQIRNQLIGTIDGSFYHEYLINTIPDNKLVLYSSYFEMLEGLINGEVDYVLTVDHMFNDYIMENKSFSITIDDSIESFNTILYSIKFPETKEGENLATLFNIASNLVDINIYMDKYYEELDLQDYYNQKSNYTFIIIVLLVALVLFTSLFLIYYKNEARIDALTQAKNRYALFKDIRKELTSGYTLIYMDINKFKDINDIYGHDIGDLVLIELVKAYKGNDKLNTYRIGGDEFVIIQKFKDEEHIKRVVESFISFDVYSEIFPSNFIEITTSIGILNIEKNTTLDESLIIVDEAMYEAKNKSLKFVKINQSEI